MSDIKQWIITIGVFSVFSGVMLCMIPKSRLKKTYSAITGVLMVYVIMLPLFKTGGINIDLDSIFAESDEVSEQLEEKSDSVVILSAERGVESAVRLALDESGINCIDVSAECELDGDTLVIRTIEVQLADSKDKSRAGEVISRYVEKQTQILIRTDGG